MEKPIGILPVGFCGSVINVGIEIKEEAYGVSPRRDMSPTCP